MNTQVQKKFYLGRIRLQRKYQRKKKKLTPFRFQTYEHISPTNANNSHGSSQQVVTHTDAVIHTAKNIFK